MACRSQIPTASTVSVAMPDSRALVGLVPLVLPLVCLRQTLVPEVWATERSPERPIPPPPASLLRDSGLLTLTLTTLIIGEVSRQVLFSFIFLNNLPVGYYGQPGQQGAADVQMNQS